METLRIILRVLHITSGTLWVGSAVFITLFLEPTVHKAGDVGGRFMERLVTETPLMKYMIFSSLMTVISGVVLYGMDSRFAGDWILTREGMIFTIGTVAGLVGLRHRTVRCRANRWANWHLRPRIGDGGGPPSSVQLTEMSSLQMRATRFGRLELVLMVISVVGMAGARFF